MAALMRPTAQAARLRDRLREHRGVALAEVVNPDACANPAAFETFVRYAQRRR
jgi:hypothetical protein